jgi:hypothetical protein
MKQKIRIVMDTEIVRLAKKRAAEERRPLGDLVQQALVNHLRKETPTTPQERKKAYRLFCERPMKISSRQFRYILNEDMWSPVNVDDKAVGR